MEKGDYTLDNFYSELPYNFKPSSDIPQTGYQIDANQLGTVLNPTVANQVGELNMALNSGVVPVEVGALDPKLFDTIPKQHFQEMRRKAKLAEAKISLHAPLVEASGIVENTYDEMNQEYAENHLKDVMDKAAQLDNEENVPVTIHSSNYQGSTFKFRDNPETGEREKVEDTLVVFDRERKQIAPIKEDIKFYPGGEEVKEKIYAPRDALEVQNRTVWIDSLDKIDFERENAEKIIYQSHPVIEGRYLQYKQGALSDATDQEIIEFERLDFATAHLHEAQRSVNASFSKAYKAALDDGDKEMKNALDKISESYGKLLEKKGKNEEEMAKKYMPQFQSKALGYLTNELRKLNPRQFIPVEEFAKKKASETFSNVAMHTYDNYEKKGKAAPILSIENLYSGMGFSQASDLKELVEESQKKFTNNLMKKENISESKAKKVAEKLIGVTWDVGHSNINKKQGFTDKDLANEAKEIAKHVKHVHLTDNFGYSDSHLPHGMGNVPIKELMEALGEEGSKARKINEVGGWINNFKTNPFGQILESFGSPIYSTSDGPYWSQRTGFQQSYVGGYGHILPSTHYETFGSGFSRLPQELGGSIQGGAGGRMGGGRE